MENTTRNFILLYVCMLKYIIYSICIYAFVIWRYCRLANAHFSLVYFYFALFYFCFLVFFIFWISQLNFLFLFWTSLLLICLFYYCHCFLFASFPYFVNTIKCGRAPAAVSFDCPLHKNVKNINMFCLKNIQLVVKSCIFR